MVAVNQPNAIAILQRDLGKYDGNFETKLPPRGVMMMRLTGK